MNQPPTNNGGRAPLQSKSGDNIIRMAGRHDPFARIPHDVLNDHRLSWRAKGVLCYLIGKPPGWKTRVVDIRKHGKEGERSIRTALMELRMLGYVQLVQLRDGQKIKEWVWKVSDSPIFEKLDGRNAHVENVDVDSCHHSKKECTKNDSKKNQTEESKESALRAEPSFSAAFGLNPKSKSQQLREIPARLDVPDRVEFDQFLESEGIYDTIMDYRDNLFSQLCRNKWHEWREELRHWRRIANWESYVLALARTIEQTKNGPSRPF